MRKLINNRRFIRMFALVVGGCLLWYLDWRGLMGPAALISLAAAYPVGAPLVFTAIYAVSVAALLPTSPLNIAAGVFWGPWLGSLVAIVGSWAGALMAFSLSRATFGQPFARRVDVRLINWARQELEHHGWKVIAFVRLNPIFPGAINHVFGLTSMPLGTFAWATLVFAAPLTIAFAVMGHLTGDLVIHGTMLTSRLWLVLFGLAAFGLILAGARWMHLASGRPVVGPSQPSDDATENVTNG